MVKQASKNPLKHLKVSDVRGVAQLATEATTNVTRIAEGVHQSVWRSVGMPGGRDPGRTRGLTGLAYQSVYAVTQWVGSGAGYALKPLERLLNRQNQPDSVAREIVLAALNGLVGDRLNESQNPLVTTMAVRSGFHALDVTQPSNTTHPSGKLLVMIHGLCMTDFQWMNKVGEDVFNLVLCPAAMDNHG